MRLVTKQPAETLDYDIRCDKRMDASDVIVSVTASVSGPDNNLLIPRTTHYDDTIAKVYLEGGTNDATYKITLLVITLNGRTIETEFLVHVKDV